MVYTHVLSRPGHGVQSPLDAGGISPVHLRSVYAIGRLVDASAEEGATQNEATRGEKRREIPNVNSPLDVFEEEQQEHCP